MSKISYDKNHVVRLILLGMQGLVLGISLATEAQMYTYDDNNLLRRAEYADGTVINYVYDAAGNRISRVVTSPNKLPIANAGVTKTVRLGSLVALDGSASTDPDNSPSPLSFGWTQVGTPAVTLSGVATAKPTFTPQLRGTYTFNLVVSDGQASSAPAGLVITVPALGDIDLDGDIDNNDLARITSALNTKANGPNDLRDLDGDGMITALDARKLRLLCTRPHCAVRRGVKPRDSEERDFGERRDRED
jgi:YD repeat-containing protein